MIKKNYPANKPEILCFQQAKSHMYLQKKKSLCIKFDHSSRILLNWGNIIEIIGLLSCGNLQITISKVSISVF